MPILQAGEVHVRLIFGLNLHAVTNIALSVLSGTFEVSSHLSFKDAWDVLIDSRLGIPSGLL